MRKTVINLIRGQVVKCLVKTFLAIKFEPNPESVPKFGSGIKRVKINVVVFKRPPQTFYENIVLHPASAVHTDGDVVAFKQTCCKGLTCELSALVGIENLAPRCFVWVNP
jgi:hypothetical protein